MIFLTADKNFIVGLMNENKYSVEAYERRKKLVVLEKHLTFRVVEQK